MLGLFGHVVFKLCHINPLADVLSKILKSETSFFAVHSWLMFLAAGGRGGDFVLETVLILSLGQLAFPTLLFGLK